MGWTSYHATYYKNGEVDRKAECDAFFLEGLNRGHYKIEKSAMVGRTYYAAVRQLEKSDGNGSYEPIPEEEQEVFGMVILTSIKMSDYFNFFYKEISEDMGPIERDCPLSVLDKLTPTDSDWANAWRDACRKNHEERKRLNDYPVGTKILVNGRQYTKSVLRKRKKWIDHKRYTYIRPADIISYGYELV